MPFSSSPCTAAVRQSVGPGIRPLTTSTGVATGTPSNNSVADQDSRADEPGAMLLPRSSSGPATPAAEATASAKGTEATCASNGSIISSTAKATSLAPESGPSAVSSRTSAAESTGSTATSPADTGPPESKKLTSRVASARHPLSVRNVLTADCTPAPADNGIPLPLKAYKHGVNYLSFVIFIVFYSTLYH